MKDDGRTISLFHEGESNVKSAIVKSGADVNVFAELGSEIGSEIEEESE